MFSFQIVGKLCFASMLGLGFIFIAVISLLPFQAQSIASSGLVTVQNRYFVRDGARFEVRGMNYYPKDFAWDKFWTNYTDPVVSAQINQELDKAKLLGINTVRLFVPYQLFSGMGQTAPYPSYLADFINRLQTRNMLAIVTLFDFYASDSTAPYSSMDYMASKQHISTVVNTLGVNNPTLLAWDIKNELDRDYADFSQAQVKAWANEMISYTRQLDLNHLITISFYGAGTGTLCYNPAVTTQVYSPAIAAEFAPAVDFVSMHYFLSERCFENDLQALQSLIGNKPVVLGEFGLHTLATPSIPCARNPTNPACDDSHTESDQTVYYNALLSLSEAYGAAGYLFWTLTDFSYILPSSQESHHCHGLLRNNLVDVCQMTNSLDYTEKPATGTIRRHYEQRVAYLDLFDAWVDASADAAPTGWTDNWSAGGGLLRGYNPAQLLWSHSQGKVAFSKFVTNGISISGLAFSPVLTNVAVDQYPFLRGQVSSYSVRNAINGSNSILHMGVREGGQITRLLTIIPATSLPRYFSLDLRQPPISWSGVHNFQIVLELVPEGGTNGYSAVYELDWIALEGFAVYLPLLVK